MILENDIALSTKLTAEIIRAPERALRFVETT